MFEQWPQVLQFSWHELSNDLLVAITTGAVLKIAQDLSAARLTYRAKQVYAWAKAGIATNRQGYD